MFRLVASVFVPLLVLSAIEGLLRLVSFGNPVSFFLRTRISERPVIVDNATFGRRFFTPPDLARKPLSFVLPEQKTDDSYRIFVLGESAALGDPSPAFGFSRILDRMLRAEYPGARFEVINTGMVAINSHVIRCIARDCAKLQPDVFIVYMGNNEVVGPYGPGTAFHAFSSSLAAIRTGIALRGTRVGQLVDFLLRLPSRARDRAAQWSGMQQFLDHRVAADDPRLAAAYRHFEHNLRDIVDAGTGAGARVLLCTVGVNLRTSPPFGSNDDANAAFREAQQLDAAGRFDKALARYTEARDLDTLRFRADTQINAAIRRVAAGADPNRIALVDAEKVFAKAAAQGIAGDDVFLEHVHMNFHGNYVLADALREALAAQLPERIASRRALGAVLDEPACGRQLAFTDWDRFSIDEDVYRRLGTPPFTFQLDHDARASSIARDLEARRGATDPAGLAEAVTDYTATVEQFPDDWMLHQNFGNLLVAAGDVDGAMREYRSAFQAVPQAAEPYIKEALALAANARTEEALVRMLTHNPEHPRGLVDVCMELGSSCGSRGDHARAAVFFGMVADAEPGNAEAHYNLAMALAAEGRWTEAIRHLERVVAVDPDDAGAKSALDAARAAEKNNGRGPP